MNVLNRAVIHFCLSADGFDDAQVRDEAIFHSCKELAIHLLNAGLQPFGDPRLVWLDPEKDRYYTGKITGRLLQKAVPVVPIRPEQWDVRWN